MKRKAQPPGDPREWHLPYGRKAVAQELELCCVPLDANTSQALTLLALNAVWAPWNVVQVALRLRREQAAQRDTAA